jgi:hypothetical protein
MAKYATFDGDGRPAAFYDRDINGDRIPGGAVALTDAQWRDFVDHPGLRAWQGGAVVAVLPRPHGGPRHVGRRTLLAELAKAGLYRAFRSWKDAQDDGRQVYFDEEATFAEDDGHVAALFTGLGIDRGAFYDEHAPG